MMNIQLTTRYLVTLVVMAAFAIAVAPITAQADTNDDFTPKLSVCTDVNFCVLTNYSDQYPPEIVPPVFNGTTQAGANPKLTLRMQKSKLNGCEPGTWIIVDYGQKKLCEPTSYNQEQDIKRWVNHFPPGLLPDANAAPYCDARRGWLPFGTTYERYLWSCENPESVIGAIFILTQKCYRNLADPPKSDGCNLWEQDPDFWIQYIGTVYNERPRPGEQGRLMILWPGIPNRPDFWTWQGTKSDVIIKVRESDAGIDAIADDIPDVVNYADRVLGTDWPPEFKIENKSPGGPYEIIMVLDGSIGKEMGHPLLTNPTYCDSQTFEAEFQGWAVNATDRMGIGEDREPQAFGPNGEPGKIATDSTPYQATECDAIPYAPTFAASADSEAPGAAAALSTVITQKDNEATTKKVHVEFPKGMGVNINSTLKPCSAADLAAKSCPELSKMGTVSAESRLLPKRAILGDSVKEEDEVLTGNVYLTGQEGDKLTLSALLSGFIDVRLDAKAGVGADGTVTATFDDLPALPYNKFTLNLFGGNRGLLTNPRKCGTHTTRTTFTSHSGKVHTVETTSKVKGCSPAPEPEFEVDLSNDGKGKRTAVELDLSVRDRHIKKVTFGLPRYLKFSTKRLGKKKKFGSLAIETERGDLESSLSLSQSVRVKRKKKKAIRFSTKGALNKLKVSLFKRKVGTKKVRIRTKKVRIRTKKVRIRTKSGKKKTVKRSVLKSRMSFKSLPKQDIKGLRVELNPSESRFLRNPKGCKKPLRFLAFVTTSDGKRHVLSQKVRLKGKGCSKKKKQKT